MLTPPPAGKGSRVRIKQPKLPEGAWEITVWDAPAYFEMQQESGGVTSLAGHRVEGLDEGQSRLTLSVDIRGWLVPVFGIFSKSMTTRYLASEAEHIKRAAESSGT